MFHFFRANSVFDFLRGKKFITFIGAGGKTTLSEKISRMFLEAGLNPVITVTTKIYAVEPYILEREISEEVLRSRRFFRVGGDLKEGKLLGVSEETIRVLGEFYDIVLIEGDGSKGRPLKYCGENEPVIPDLTDLVIVVCGLDGLGKPLKEAVFRWEMLKDRKGFDGEEIVGIERFIDIVEKGMLKVRKGMEYAVCLNKYDAVSEKSHIWEILRLLYPKIKPTLFLVSSARYGIFYVFESLKD